MATVTAAAVSLGSLFLRPESSLVSSPTKVVSVQLNAVGQRFPTLRSSWFRVSCVARPETVDRVCEIVRKQLALPPETELTPESKFASLGADSLDTVEIVMALEEEFGIGVEEEGSQNITTVQEVADMIEKLVLKKPDA